MNRWTAAAATLLLVPVSMPAAGQDVSGLRTAPERTNYEQTTRYADVAAFVERLAAASPVIQLDTFGYTLEGRALPLAVVGRGLRDASPESVRASGRTVVYLQGNIHAGEVEGKESLLMLLREIAQGRHQQLLDSLVLLVAPIYNADGNERVLLTNRPAQHGPIGGMGQRPNAQGFDLNRDHMKLDSPEARSLAQMMTRYDPHVSMDLHTTNGTRHAYYLTYSPPLHPNTAPQITTLLREQWLPHVTRVLKQKYDWDYYYYGNAQQIPGTSERGWYTFDHRPRFNNNYIGLRNRIAILSEAYSYAAFEDRITATSRFVEEVLAYAHANATGIRRAVAAAERAPIIGQQLAVRATTERSPAQVDILMGDVAEERNPFTGAVMLRRLPVRRPERMWEYGTFRGTVMETVPAAYILLPTTPPNILGNVVSKLDAHGVRYTRTAAERTVAGETFRIDTMVVANNEFQGHRERRVEGAWVAGNVTVAAGSIIVPVDQPLGRLAFYLLEPRSDDGFVNWNMYDRVIEAGRGIPIARVHTSF